MSIIWIPGWMQNLYAAENGGDPDDQCEEETEHDNEADGLVKCEDCHGTGVYEGLWVREHCEACSGSGWL